jgi:hypothetical protein
MKCRRFSSALIALSCALKAKLRACNRMLIMISAIKTIREAEYKFSLDELTRLIIAPTSKAKVGTQVSP